MSSKFKFVKRAKKPSKPAEGTNWRATPVITNRLTTRSVCKVVTRNTTTAPTEAESTFNLVCDGIVHELQQGNSVQLGELGWLRLSFSSEGVDNLEDFNAATMIKNVKIVFTPSKTLMNDIKNGLEFENVGVVDEGFTFPSTKSYLEFKQTGKLPVQGGTGTTPGTGEGEDDGDHQLG